MKDVGRKIASLMLPKQALSRVRSWYTSYRQATRPKLDETEFRNILTRQLGLREGDVLFIHSSLSELFIGFSPARTIGILREIVGTEGTLLFPAAQFRVRAEDYLQDDPVFDVRHTRTVMGFLPEYVRRMPESHRSLHPINSVVALGKHARSLTEDHHLDIYPCGVKSPYYLIIERGGKIVGLGIAPHYCLTFVHVLEDVIKDEFPLRPLNDRPHTCRVINDHGEEITVDTLVPHRRIRHRNIKRFIRKHLSDEDIRTMHVRGSTFFVADSRKLFAHMKELAARGLTIYTSRAYKE